MKFRFLALLPLLPAAALAQDKGYDLVDVNWSLKFDVDQRTIWGEVTNSVRFTNKINEVLLHSGPLTIDKLTVDGKPAKFKKEGDQLLVSSPGASVGKVSKIRILYHGQPTAGIYFVPAAQAHPAKDAVVYTQGEAEDTRDWLITYDLPDDKATSSGRITVPKGWFALSNGKLVKQVDKGANSTFYWSISRPHATYLISIAASKFEGETVMLGDLPVSWYVPAGLKKMGKAAFGGTEKMVKFYGELTGLKYPYEKFAQCAVPDFMFGGMENITAVTQTIGAIHDPSEQPMEDAQGLVLHELAHQWFGDTITCTNWSHIWINEGWATFLPHFYNRMDRGQDAYDIERYGTMTGAWQVANNSNRAMIRSGFDLPMDNFDGFAYGGGAARMFALMFELGENNFWKGAKEYMAKYKFKNASTEDFFASMSKSTGVDLDGFRKQYFYTNNAAKLTTNIEGTTLHIKQVTPGFTLQVPVWILGKDGWIKKNVSVSDRDEGVVFLGDDFGKPIMIDPENHLFVGYDAQPPLTVEQGMKVWAAAPNASTKVRLLQMVSFSQADLEVLFDQEKSPVVKNLIVGNMKSGLDFALRGVSNPDKMIAWTSLHLLSRMGRMPAALNALTSISKSHPIQRFRSQALRTLIEYKNDEKLVEEAWNTPMRNEELRVAALNWYSAHQPEKGRMMALQQLSNPINEVLRRTSIDILGRLKDKPGERVVFNALARVAREPSFGSRSSAINALVNYGDKAAIEIIRPATKARLFYMRRTATDAINRLGG